MEEVLSYVIKCRKVCHELDLPPTDTTLSLLLLYEFEASVCLNLHDAARIFDTLPSLSLSDPKIYETIAGM